MRPAALPVSFSASDFFVSIGMLLDPVFVKERRLPMLVVVSVAVKSVIGGLAITLLGNRLRAAFSRGRDSRRSA